MLHNLPIRINNIVMQSGFRCVSLKTTTQTRYYKSPLLIRPPKMHMVICWKLRRKQRHVGRRVMAQSLCVAVAQTNVGQRNEK